MGREVDAPAGTPLDRNRGGGLTKVAVLLSAYDRDGFDDNLQVLAEQMQDALDARTSRIERHSWADKLRRLLTAIFNEDADMVHELHMEYDCPALRAAMTNRSWQAWRLGGYGDD